MKDTKKIKYNLVLSGEAEEVLINLAEKLNITKAEVFRRALSVLKISYESKEEGLTVGVFDGDYLDIDFKGWLNKNL